VTPFVPVETPENLEPDRRPGPYDRLRAKITVLMSHVPLRTRITALVMVAVGLSVALASIAAWVTVRNQILSQLDTSLDQRATLATQYILQGRDVTPLDDSVFVEFQGNGTVTNTNVHPQQAVTEIPITPADLEVAKHTRLEHFSTIYINGVRYRALTLQVNTPNTPLLPPEEQSAVLLAQSMADTQQTLGRLSLVSILVGIAGIAVAGSAGITVGRAGLRPVDRLTEATEYVARTGDLRPIEVQGTDELARLATSFNSMLTALARSQEHQRRLIADAGHELRTPLTSMRTNIDLLSQIFNSSSEQDEPGADGGPGSNRGPGLRRVQISDADRAELIGDVRAQMEELSVLVGDLVELSRDATPQSASEPLNLGDVVRQAVDRVRRRAPHLKFDIQLQPWFLEGDPATLERAVTNLLDNAAKWSPEEGTVTVRLSDGLLQVADQGPGIAEEDMPHVFERFYRSTEARTMPGSGLGLAIVRQAAENHGGRVAAARAPSGGALLGLWLPGSPTEDEAPQNGGTAGNA
jgi:two-component system, OmpR family, sensor histidine kinase MprB